MSLQQVFDPDVFLISVTSPFVRPPMLFLSISHWSSYIHCGKQGPCFGYGGCSVAFGSLCGTYVPQNTYKNLTGEAGYNTMTGRQFFTPAIVEVFKI